MQEVARQREAQVTVAAKVLTWAGSAFLLVPLALVCCVLLVRAGLRREAIAVAVSLGGAMLISDVVKLLVLAAAPPARAPAVGERFELSLRARDAGERLLVLAGAGGTHGSGLDAAGARAGRRRRVLLVAAVAISRVYLGVHYVSDVVAGVLLGTGWAVYVARCVRDATFVRRREVLR